MPDTPSRTDIAPFAAVRSHELEAIRARRRVHDPNATAEGVETSLAGLALSGGGIRSATFSLGVLQALHDLGHLAKFDYLSTVSGGGFTGAWWTTWLSRTDFMASHIRSEETLAERMVAAGVPESDRIRTALAALRAGRDASAARQKLIDVLVAALNARRTPGHGTDQIFAEFGDALTRIFPAREKVESDRASDYRDPAMPDGALAAGADPVHHLRLFANYLTPRKGLMSVDTWRAAAVVSRNLIFTWCVLLPILLAVVLAGQLYFLIQPFDSTVTAEFLAQPGIAARAHADVMLDRALVAARVPVALFVGMVVVALLWIGFNHAGTRWTHAAAMIGGTLIVGGALLLSLRPGGCDGIGACLGELFSASTDTARKPALWDYLYVAAIVIGVALVAARIVSGPGAAVGATGRRRTWYHPVALLLALVAILLGPEIAQGDAGPVGRQVGGNQATRWHGRLLMWFVLTAVTFAFAGFAHEGIDWLLGVEWGTLQVGKLTATVSAVAAAAGSIFTALKGSPAAGHDARENPTPTLASRIVFALTPPLVLVVLAAAMAWVGHRVLTRVTVPPESQVALPFFMVMALLGVAIWLVYGLLEVAESAAGRWSAGRVTWTVAAAVAAVAVVILWLRPAPDAATVTYGFSAAVIAGAIAWVGATFDSRRLRPLVLFTAAFVTMLVFTVGSFTGWCEPTATPRAACPGLLLLLVVLAWIVTVGWMSDPNALGLHTFYKARLVRAYLGASNPRRHVSGADIHDAVIGDDMRLRDLAPTRAGGPYPLINTTLNLVGGRDLATAQRSAAYFTLSPGYCGSVRTGYRPTAEYMNGSLSVGAAVATSGAAASPNMGSKTPSAALAMLLTLFNVRLGLWVPTPHEAHWASAQTRLWPYYLLRESLSQTNDLGSYCYLTDGGHFDNTGLYSLVERGCRRIVMIDNGADPRPAFEDLGEAIRRCRIDFGAEIELDVTGFRGAGAAGAHFAVGKIHYGAAHLRELGITTALEGTIVWIKPAVVGGEPADVVQYKLQNAVFPQQSTRDQWFDEAQFESYRQLAIASVRAVFAQHPTVLG